MNSNPNHKQSSRRTPATTRRDLSQVKLRPVTEPERGEWEASTRDEELLQQSFWSLDDLVEYPFKDGDTVWVRTAEENWLHGKVTGKNIRRGQTRRSMTGFFYPVCFGPKMKTRKYFAPLNGDMKPDTEEVRDLLKESGWIEPDSNGMMDDGNDSSYTELSN